MKTVLSIAGFDPSSGAGVTADLMVFAAHGLFGTSCITALTVQSTMSVTASHAIAPEIVAATLQAIQDDLPPAGIKVGMLATAELVAVVADFLESHPSVPVVLDPVFRSSSGRELLSPEGVDLMKRRLIPRARVVSPNLDELGVLVDKRVTTREEMATAARTLQQAYPGLAVFATGGHLEPPDDFLVTADGAEHWLPGEFVSTTSTHGTGCALASALLSGLVSGLSLLQAAQAAKLYVAEALRTAKPLGHGRGPIHHLWPLRNP